MKTRTQLTRNAWISAAALAVVCLAIAPLAIARARRQDASGQQGESVAEAARKAREKKQNEAKSPKVWDNDNVPSAAPINVVGPASEPAANAAAGKGAAPQPAGDKPATITKEQILSVHSGMESDRQHIESLKSEIDVLQRKYMLDQQNYYSKPDYVKDKEGAAALADEKAQIDAKQQEIDDAQKHIDELQSQLPPAPSEQDSK